MRNQAVQAPARSLVRSQWDRITFYGKRIEEEPEGGKSELPDIPLVEEVEPPPPPEPKVYDDEPEFVISGKKWKAKGKLTEEGFVVYVGSTVNAVTESFKKEKSYFPIREKLEAEGVIANGTFTSDYTFKSAAQAGSVVACAPVSARTAWKTEPDEDGAVMTYGEAHPKLREPKKAKNPAVKKPKVEKGQSVYRSHALVEGRKWDIEWRGQVPVRKGGVYSGVRCA